LECIFTFCSEFTITLTKHGSIKKGVLPRSIWFIQVKELSLCHKLKYSTPCIFATCWCKLLKFQTLIILSNIIYSLEYLRSTTLGCKDKGIRKSEFVVQTQFLSCFFFWHPTCFQSFLLLLKMYLLKGIKRNLNFYNLHQNK